MCKSAYKISKLSRIFVNLFSLCSHFGNNQEDAAYKNIERTPSLLQVVNVDHHHLILYCCGIYVFVSLSVGCHAFVSPMLACSAERRVLVCTIGTSPLSMR